MLESCKVEMLISLCLSKKLATLKPYNFQTFQRSSPKTNLRFPFFMFYLQKNNCLNG